jgi:hypothetical protein
MDLDTFLVGMLGAVVGGVVTYIIERQIQARAWKREEIEEIYAPLLDQLGDVEAKLYRLETHPSYPEWKGLRERHLFHLIKKGLKEKLWKFFDVDLHNFNIGLIATIKEIYPQIKEEILQKIKAEWRAKVQETTPFKDRVFWIELAKLVIKKEEDGYLGGIDNYEMVARNYRELEKDFETPMPLEDFIKNFASKIKDRPLLKEVKDELKGLLFKTQDLRREVEKEMGLKQATVKSNPRPSLSTIKKSISNISKTPHFKRDLFLLVVVVPVVLSLLFLLPDSTKDQLILHKDSPQALTLYTSNFIHLDAAHLFGNVIFYIVLVIPVYILNLRAEQIRKFYLMMLLFFTLLPVLILVLDLRLLPTGTSLGFSGIVAAFLGFLPYSAFSYFKKSEGWKTGISTFLFIVLFFSFGFILLTYFEFTLYNFILLTIVWGLSFGFFILAIRNAAIKESLSSMIYALKKKRLLLSVPLIYFFGLGSLFPENIRIGNGTVGIDIHYIGFFFGFFVPYLFIIREEFKRKKK